jgi:hypothetical protein
MKIQTAFRFEKEFIQKLKEQAKIEKRSLNNFVEVILADYIDNIPNDVTISALKDVMSGTDLSKIDNLDEYKKSLLNAV